ncbi:MAG: recombination protein RecR [Deltaproteobacteria bacterium HGW-Deltaproteobacteria-15]|jgi:recombination protein RecR|nr:MAG: recombination protein RecR [Deltaproteobacteria bacterium HGW-Deltaproteobacteria-15]
MGIYPPPLEKLIQELSRLPGVGQKSATRLALFILRSERELAEGLSQSLLAVKDRIRFCSVCYNLTEEDPCPICNDPNRANGVVCVVEGPGDQLAIEESRVFQGRYHVLHGVLSPLEGIGPEDLKIGELLARLGKEEVTEVILATNPTTEGESTAAYLAKILSTKEVRISRIALGIPMGGDLKYMDSMTLQHALRSRNPLQA